MAQVRAVPEVVAAMLETRVSDYIAGKFNEIQSRVPVRLSGFTRAGAQARAAAGSFEEQLSQSAAALETDKADKADRAAKQGTELINRQSSGIIKNAAVIFPNIKPAPAEQADDNSKKAQNDVAGDGGNGGNGNDGGNSNDGSNGGNAGSGGGENSAGEYSRDGGGSVAYGGNAGATAGIKRGDGGAGVAGVADAQNINANGGYHDPDAYGAEGYYNAAGNGGGAYDWDEDGNDAYNWDESGADWYSWDDGDMYDYYADEDGIHNSDGGSLAGSNWGGAADGATEGAANSAYGREVAGIGAGEGAGANAAAGAVADTGADDYDWNAEAWNSYNVYGEKSDETDWYDSLPDDDDNYGGAWYDDEYANGSSNKTNNDGGAQNTDDSAASIYADNSTAATDAATDAGYLNDFAYDGHESSIELTAGEKSRLLQNIDYINRTGNARQREQIEDSIVRASLKYGLDHNLIRAVITQESAFSPTSLSSAGAQGLMQLMPGTADSLGVGNPWNIDESIDAGTRLLRSHLENYNGDLAMALAAYNAGPGAVQRYNGVPPYKETQDYIKKVIGYYDQYAAGGYNGGR